MLSWRPKEERRSIRSKGARLALPYVPFHTPMLWLGEIPGIDGKVRRGLFSWLVISVWI